MSGGLYKSLEQATGTNQANKDIVQMAVAEVIIPFIYVII